MEVLCVISRLRAVSMQQEQLQCTLCLNSLCLSACSFDCIKVLQLGQALCRWCRSRYCSKEQQGWAPPITSHCIFDSKTCHLQTICVRRSRVPICGAILGRGKQWVVVPFLYAGLAGCLERFLYQLRAVCFVVSLHLGANIIRVLNNLSEAWGPGYTRGELVRIFREICDMVYFLRKAAAQKCVASSTMWITCIYAIKMVSTWTLWLKRSLSVSTVRLNLFGARTCVAHILHSRDMVSIDFLHAVVRPARFDLRNIFSVEWTESWPKFLWIFLR